MSKARIVIADDHSIVLEAYRQLLEPEFEVVGTAENGQKLLNIAPGLAPDIIMLDISMPTMNGLDVTKQLRAAVPRAKLIFVTMMSEPFYISQAFELCASGYVLKQSVAEELVFAIKEVLKGRLYVSPSVAENLVEQALNPTEPGPARATATNDQLSARQREVLQLIAEGQSTKEIASTLNVSIKTVEFHKTRIMKQLGVHSTAELTKHAITIGLIAMPQQPTVPGPHV